MSKVPLLLSLLNNCNNIHSLTKLHAHIITNGYFTNQSISKSLLKAYCTLPNVLHLCPLLFNQIKNPQIEDWNSIIKAFSQSPYAQQAIHYYNDMVSHPSSQPTCITFSFLLKACEKTKASGKCKEAHGSIIRSGYGSDCVVCSSLIRTYAAVGETDIMRKMFDEMPVRDIVTWNSIISCYTHIGCHYEALELYDEMKSMNVGFDGFTLVGLLSACAHVGAISMGEELHELGYRNSLLENIFVGNALIDMYAKCGSLDKALCVFNTMKRKDLFSYNSIIFGYGVHGFADLAISFFNKMLTSGLKPDSITFLGLLCGCSHQGLVDNGVEYFNLMSSKFSLKPEVKHYGCMIDLFGRAGNLRKSVEVIERSPFPNSAILWRTLLGSCRIHKDVDYGEKAMEKLSELNAMSAGDCVLLAGIYANAKDIDGFVKMRRLIKDEGLSTTKSWSSIEIFGQIHRFDVDDRSHIDSEEIYCKLEEMVQEAKSVGYRELEEFGERKGCFHSERLALALGLARTGERTSLRIVKSLRVCKDCHSFTKFVSKAYHREIIVRDRVRFHHFKNGLCSCNDYW